MTYAIRVILESGRAAIVGTFDRRYRAHIALWQMDMCGITFAEVIEIEV